MHKGKLSGFESFRNLSVGVLRKSSGAFHVFVNGEDHGLVSIDVPSCCYAGVDIFGNCTVVSIVHPRVIKQGLASIVIAPWKIADFKNLVSVVDDSSALLIGDDRFVRSQGFAHESLPGFLFFLKVYPTGKAEGPYVTVELSVEKSGKKSSATALSAFFSATLSFTAEKSTYPTTSKLARLVGKSTCVIEKFVPRETIKALCADDGSITCSGKITVSASFFRNRAVNNRSDYESGALSDFKIQVESDPMEFPVHKHVLTEASSVFMAMLTPQSDEAKEKLLIKDFSLDAVKAMLQFIYGDPLCFDGLQELSIDVLGLASDMSADEAAILIPPRRRYPNGFESDPVPLLHVFIGGSMV